VQRSFIRFLPSATARSEGTFFLLLAQKPRGGGAAGAPKLSKNTRLEMAAVVYFHEVAGVSNRRGVD
jgi:hypothetical protein